MKSIEPEHRCRGSFTNASEEEFPVRWIRGDSLDQMGLVRRASKKIWFGVCGFSHRICRAAYYGPLDLIVFQDVIISDGKCEDGRYCLARQCPLNRTSESGVKKLLGARTQKQIADIRTLTAARHCTLFEKHAGQGGVILPPSS